MKTPYTSLHDALPASNGLELSNLHDRKTVVKDNRLNQASMMLTLDEKRLLYFAMAQFKSVPTADGNWTKEASEIKVYAKDFANFFELDQKSVYKQLKTVSKTLFNKEVTMLEYGTNKPILSRWTDFLDYSDKEGYVRFGIASKIRPYVEGLHGHFTRFKLVEIKEFKSRHTIRLYELLMQYKTTGVREDKIADLKYYFGLQATDKTAEKYPRWVDFNKRVLKPSVKEINDVSTFHVVATPIKNGRKIAKIRFEFNERAQRRLALD